jgi:hypothetical protein
MTASPAATGLFMHPSWIASSLLAPRNDAMSLLAMRLLPAGAGLLVALAEKC